MSPELRILSFLLVNNDIPRMMMAERLKANREMNTEALFGNRYLPPSISSSRPSEEDTQTLAEYEYRDVPKPGLS